MANKKPTEVIAQPGEAPAEQNPQRGGLYIRNEDGSLKREEGHGFDDDAEEKSGEETQE